MKILSDFHDAAFLGLDSAQAPERLVLMFRKATGSRVKISLINCSIFRVVDFINQNVVSRVLCFGAEDAQDNAVARQLDWMTGLTGTESYLTSKARQQLLDEIGASLKSIFVIVPSCGAELSALYEHLEMEELQGTELP